MLMPDDCTLPAGVAESVKQEALKILNEANAIGQYPTPVSEIMKTAKIEMAPPGLWDDNLLSQLRLKGKNNLLSAISKVMGVLDSYSKTIYIDPDTHPHKETFLKLHETAHAIIPWQSKLYLMFEDCEKTLDPAIAAQFEREANVFASEVLFQVDRYKIEALDHGFSINTPISLSQKYGASIYSSIRRYVSTNDKPCAVIVLNCPESGNNFAMLRRIIISKKFKKYFNVNWPDKFLLDSDIGKVIPVRQGMSCPKNIALTDGNGMRHECIVEGLNTKYQIFILLYPLKEITKRFFVKF